MLHFPVVSLAAEHLVMGHLLRRNILTYKAPPGNEGYDLICIHPNPRLPVRRRTRPMLDVPAPVFRAYPREAVLAEKLHAMVDLGLANSRMNPSPDLAEAATAMVPVPLADPGRAEPGRQPWARGGRSAPAGADQ